MDRRDFLRIVCLSSAAGFVPSLGIAESGARPNILLIMTDQQFADAMSCAMGDEYIKTPNIDRIAASGMRFRRAYCANPLCVPSRSSMFSGRYPHEHGKQINSTEPQLDPEKLPNTGMVLRKAGYVTGYCGKWHLPYPTRGSVEVTGFDYMVPGGNGVDRKIAPAAMKFLEQWGKKRFFLVCSFMNPHNICEYGRSEPLPDGDVGKSASIDDCPPVPANLEKAKDQSDSLETIWQGRLRAVRGRDNKRMFAPLDKWAVDDWRHYRWSYYRMVELVDKEVGTILDKLASLGLDENTVIIFTSDHGDGIGSHRWAQKNMFYDEVARIPFIISHKGVTKSGVSDCLVNNGIDLMPTICDYAGADVPKGCHGESLRKVAAGSGDIDREYVVSSTHFVQDIRADGEPIDMQGRMVRSDRFKYYIFDQGRQPEMLIDMVNDPGEMVNIACDSTFKDVLSRHRGYLLKYAEGVGDRFAMEFIKNRA